MTPETWQQLKSIFHASLELEPNERAGFVTEACAGDPGLRNRIDRLLASHNQSSGFLASPALVEAGIITTEEYAEGDGSQTRVGERIGPYEIIREIGHGGMGTVFLAVRADDQYRKEVAIKLVNRGMDTDTILRRFMMERQILANLEHPNIASLLDGGSTSDGLPYFVMEYIEGRPITEFCDARAFTTTERLELFRQVCAALQYAHQNLVVHRDIKPSNILVTAEGLPKLLDFGVAKLLSPGWATETGEATAGMVRLMTPEYASPEQLQGLPITTTSDVYSLGVVLYQLLSGHHPYRSTARMLEELARAILKEEPEKPSTAASRPQAEGEKNGYQNHEHWTTNVEHLTSRTNPRSAIRNPKSLRGDLDNIVLKALRKEPQRRYASVQEFSEDVRRHLEGLPVGASPNTFGYRAGKFVQRNRAGVLAAAAIIIILLTATGITTWQARVARSERAKAERRFNETRKLSTYLMTDVFDALSRLPGAAQVQKELTENALRHLDTLAQEETDDVVLLGELAAVYVRLGEVQVANLHDTDWALQRFEKAVELQHKRISSAPNDVSIKRDLVFGLFKVSEMLLARGEPGSSLAVKSEILNLQQEVLAAQPNSVEDISSLAGSYQARGEVFERLKRREEAESDYRNALRMMTQAINLSKDTAQTPQQRIALSFKYIMQGGIYAQLEDWQNAAANNRTAGKMVDAVWQENPGLVQALRNTSSSHRRLAAALEKLGDYQGALENYQHSLRVVSEAAANNRVSDDLRHSEGMYTIKVGAALDKVGERKQAIELVNRGLDLDRKYIAADKNRAAAVNYSFETFQPAAEFFVAIGRRDEAVGVFQEWVRNVEKVRESVPQEPDLVWRLANIYANIGDIYSAFNPESKRISETNRAKLGNARRWYQKTIDALGDLRQMRYPNADMQDLRTATEAKLAQCEAQLK